MDPSIIAAGIGLLGTGGNAVAQGKMNRATRQFAQEQSQEQNRRNIENWEMSNKYNEERWNVQNAYDVQMRDNQRMYDMELWNTQNEYNSPRQQMQRFQEAGLNPHMVTGSSNAMSGTIATSNMDTQAQGQNKAPETSKAEWNPRATTWNSDALASMYTMKVQKAQMDLLAEQAKTQSREQDLIAAKAITELTGGKMAGLQYEIESDLKQTSIDARKEALRKLTNDANYTVHQDERSDKQLQITAKEALARIDLLKQQAKTEEQKQELQRAEIIIKKLEATYGDGLLGVPGFIGRILEGLPKEYKQVERNKDGTYKIW